jgi:RNA polymerase sigma-70 factor (ECF subfamily)
MKLAEESDEQLFIDGLREGDPSAFRKLYEQYAPRLQAFCSRFRLPPEEVAEIVQETFVRVWLHRNSVQSNAAFGTYLITIAKHLVYNNARKAAHYKKYVQQVLTQVQHEQGQQVVNKNELQQLIAGAMQQLPDKCRQVFSKSRLEGYSNQQIAEEMNISKSTVENQLNKALKIIRKSLETNGYRIVTVSGGYLAFQVLLAYL